MHFIIVKNRDWWT